MPVTAVAPELRMGVPGVPVVPSPGVPGRYVAEKLLNCGRPAASQVARRSFSRPQPSSAVRSKRAPPTSHSRLFNSRKSPRR